MSTNNNFEDFIEKVKLHINNESEIIHNEYVAHYYHQIIDCANSYFSTYELAKKRAEFIKNKTFHDISKYVIDFDLKFTNQGGKIIYCEDEKDALKFIEDYLKGRKNLSVFQYCSNMLKEIGLDKFFKENNIEYTEFNLENLIAIFTNNENHYRGYSFLNMYFDDMIAYLKQYLNLENYSSEQVIEYISNLFINKATKESVSIFSADFLLADIGGIVINDTMGGKNILSNFSKTQIVLASIDKFIPSVQDLDLFQSLLSSHSSKQVYPYNQSILIGPKKNKDLDGPENLILVLIDNGRSDVLKVISQKSILNCIDCGTCEALCPVCKFMGRNVYNGGTYGPVGNIITSYIQGFYYGAHLNFSCTLCGRCDEVCPVNIPLKELILYNRKESVSKGYYINFDKSTSKQLKKMMMKRKNLESFFNRTLLKITFKKAYGKQRNFPNFDKKSFCILWKEMNKS